MTEQKPSVISVGEVMIELTRGPDSRYGLAFGGDTFNTAVYLARAGIESARLDAELLLGKILGLTRSGLVARGNEFVTRDCEQAYASLIERRHGGDWRDRHQRKQRSCRRHGCDRRQRHQRNQRRCRRHGCDGRWRDRRHR